MYISTLFAAALLLGGSHSQGVGTLTCGNTTYSPDSYSCFDGEYLCPIYGNVVYSRCGRTCYWEGEYSCDNGQLKLRNDSVPYDLSACGEALFLPSQYVCYDNSVLCPIIDDVPYLQCSNDCYDFRQYSCSDGSLLQHYTGCTRELEEYVRFGQFYPCCDGLSYFSGVCIRLYYNTTSAASTFITSTLSSGAAAPTCVGAGGDIAGTNSTCCSPLVQVGSTCESLDHFFDLSVTALSPSTTHFCDTCKWTSAKSAPSTTTALNATSVLTDLTVLVEPSINGTTTSSATFAQSTSSGRDSALAESKSLSELTQSLLPPSPSLTELTESHTSATLSSTEAQKSQISATSLSIESKESETSSTTSGLSSAETERAMTTSLAESTEPTDVTTTSSETSDSKALKSILSSEFAPSPSPAKESALIESTTTTLEPTASGIPDSSTEADSTLSTSEVPSRNIAEPTSATWAGSDATESPTGPAPTVVRRGRLMF